MTFWSFLYFGSGWRLISGKFLIKRLLHVTVSHVIIDWKCHRWSNASGGDYLLVCTRRTMSGLLPNSASISAISAACNWNPIYNYEQCDIISTLSNMALLPSKSNSSFTWCCSSSVRALPPYRSWEVKIICPPFMRCPLWYHTSPGNPVRLFLPPPSLSEGYRPDETLAFFWQNGRQYLWNAWVRRDYLGILDSLCSLHLA